MKMTSFAAMSGWITAAALAAGMAVSRSVHDGDAESRAEKPSVGEIREVMPDRAPDGGERGEFVYETPRNAELDRLYTMLFCGKEANVPRRGTEEWSRWMYLPALDESPGETLAGLYLLLDEDTTPQERAMACSLVELNRANTQMDQPSAKTRAELMDAAEKAMLCPNPVVRRMAVKALELFYKDFWWDEYEESHPDAPPDAQPPTQKERERVSEILLALSTDECRSVRYRAFREFAGSLGEMPDPVGVLECAEKALAALDSGTDDCRWMKNQIVDFGSMRPCVNDPANVAKALRYLAEAGKPDNPDVAELRSSVFGWATHGIDPEDTAAVERYIAEMDDFVSRADAAFPENRTKASIYARALKDIFDEMDRHGESEAERAEWRAAQEKKALDDIINDHPTSQNVQYLLNRGLLE